MVRRVPPTRLLAENSRELAASFLCNTNFGALPERSSLTGATLALPCQPCHRGAQQGQAARLRHIAGERDLLDPIAVRGVFAAVEIDVDAVGVKMPLGYRIAAVERGFGAAALGKIPRDGRRGRAQIVAENEKTRARRARQRLAWLARSMAFASRSNRPRYQSTARCRWCRWW